jgi:hypothetical protein
MRLRRRSGTPKKKTPARSALLLAIIQPKPLDQGRIALEMLWDAAVLTVSTEVPEEFATELKLNAQVGGGLPPLMLVQARATAPA